MRKQVYLLALALTIVTLFALTGAVSADPNGVQAPRFPYDLVPGYGEDGATLQNADAIAKLTGKPLSSPARNSPDLRSPNMHLLASSPQTEFTNSDLAFWGNLAFVGNYGGFRIFDISEPGDPQLLADVPCFGPQNDVSVWEDLLFLSVDSVLTGPECGSQAVPFPNVADPGGWEGIRIFDVSDPTDPQFVTAVYTDCGSHTHTLVPDLANNRILLYVLSYGLISGPTCGPHPGAEDPLHNQISIVEVPLGDPAAASVIAEPKLTGEVFDITDIVPILNPTFGCHDLQVFMELGIAAAACLSEGQIWDISDPANPDTLGATHLDNEEIEIWHSAAFTWDGEIVVFGDETLFGSCQDPNQLNGRIWFHEVANPETAVASFLIPRLQPAEEYCGSHLFNVLPRNDRYILASSWYAGGVSIIDFTDPTNAVEIGYYDAQAPVPASTWSTYWYNGFVYANDIPRGFDILLLSDNARAMTSRFDYMNPQTQEMLLP